MLCVYLLHISPCIALFRFVSEERRRMIRRDYMYSAFAYPLSPVPCYARLRAAYVPRCRSAEAYDYLRTNKDKLLAQVRQARNRFFIGRRLLLVDGTSLYSLYKSSRVKLMPQASVKQLSQRRKRNTCTSSSRPALRPQALRPWIPSPITTICAFVQRPIIGIYALA